MEKNNNGNELNSNLIFSILNVHGIECMITDDETVRYKKEDEEKVKEVLDKYFKRSKEAVKDHE